MIQTVRLVDSDDNEMSLFVLGDQRQDLILQGVTAPFPAVRAVSAGRVDADGDTDVTAHHGARAVAVALRVYDGGQQALLDQLAGYLHPAKRPYLCVDDDEWAGERRLRLRSDQATAPVVDLTSNGVYRDVQVQWSAPDGVWEGSDEVTFGLLATASTSVGRIYVETFPRSYAATMGTGQIEVVNPGSTDSDQMVRMYGPCVGPQYSNDSTGETIAFTSDLIVAAGEYVEVDTRNRTAFYLSDPDASRLGNLDFANSTWWRMHPGSNSVRYHPISGVDAGCQSFTTFRPSWF